MLSLNFLSVALLALIPSTFAAPHPPTAAPFQVTNLNTFEPTGRPGSVNLYRVGFNVTDPADSSTAFCETQWDYADATTGWPSTYLANCTNPSYAFKFVDYHSYYDFTLDVRHKSKTHGRPTTRFAKGQVNLDILQCSHAASGFSVCNQKEGVQFPLQVYKTLD
ncbi:uncharacterized protein EI97DRAFT_433514 [Westerdykella ornata]|uniref:AA1-like domain-containing protein n=1 Tax=Westerdykella ornata TaxID=318751 RepID=A0A6A6JHG8_WESOR|nr:uncharacterized protein EI97DRAFT_433514 [Westerdykella ornata]KAF2276100.1 hypothetical protein EI97DRAFT_433514 [Westerdykella ornata]